MKRILSHTVFGKAKSLLILASLLGSVLSQAAGVPDTSKMNLLFIDIEDTYAGVLGCFGNPICKTPNIDRLASSGVPFLSAYCQGTACNATRSSFLTGLRPLTTRVLANGHVMNEHLPAGTLTLPEMLKKRGLYTAVIGKLFHKLDYAERQIATFDRIEMYGRPEGWKGPEAILQFPPVTRERRQTPAPKDQKSREYRLWKQAHSDRYGDSGLQPEEEADYRMAETASALIKEFAKSKKQWCLFMAQSRPHTPLIAPKKYLQMYDPAKIPDPPAPPEILKGFPWVSRTTGSNPDIFTQKPPTKQQAKEAIAAYYACVSFVDDNVGRVLSTLEKEGLADNTIVVFLGDHGWHLGDHGCWSKYSMMESVQRGALIVRVPGMPANGKACKEFVEFVDLVPTLGELLAFETPKNLESTSFAPLFKDPAKPWKQAVFMVDGDTSEVVRTRQFSYMELKGKKAPLPVALYDMEKDPWQTINVAEDPAYAKSRAQMAELLKAGWKAGLPK